MKTRPVGAEIFRVAGRINRQIWRNSQSLFCNFANVRKKKWT